MKLKPASGVGAVSMCKIPNWQEEHHGGRRKGSQCILIEPLFVDATFSVFERDSGRERKRAAFLAMMTRKIPEVYAGARIVESTNEGESWYRGCEEVSPVTSRSCSKQPSPPACIGHHTPTS